MRTFPIRSLFLSGLLSSITLAASQHQLAPRTPERLSGAIYTTDPLGRPAELFHTNGLAFLAGGSVAGSGCSGEGLADGDYYFQVTDPSGAALLSKDSIESRRLRVAGGVIARVFPGGHLMRSGPCGAKLVQIQPFLENPSSSREYRVWVTPVSEYQVGAGTFGFLPTSSKTDTFRVDNGVPPMTQTKISGTIFYDFNENGVYEPQVPGEVPLPGWKLRIDSGGVIVEVVADADGRYEFLRDMNSTHHLLTSIAPLPGFIPEVGGRWLATTPNPVDVLTNVDFVSVDFGNLFFENRTEFARSKGFWHNQGEALLEPCDPDWRIALNGLCLRNNHTSPPDPVEDTFFTVPMDVSFQDAFVELQGYLIGDESQGVLAYILGTQFTAAILNVSCGPLQDLPTYIDQENDDVLVDLDHMIEHTAGMLCDPRSANTGPDGDPEWRAHFMMCLDEWNGMNTTGTNTYTRRSVPPPILY